MEPTGEESNGVRGEALPTFDLKDLCSLFTTNSIHISHIQLQKRSKVCAFNEGSCQELNIVGPEVEHYLGTNLFKCKREAYGKYT